MARRWIATIFGVFLLLAALTIVAVGAVLIFSSSPEDVRYDFVSPSGQSDLYLIETCQRGGCSHQAVMETHRRDGRPIQLRCGLDIEASAPVFVRASVEWLTEESAIIISYFGDDGRINTLPVDFANDCNA